MIVIVTRHQGLVDFLAERGIVGEVIAHATPENIRGREVVGVLPLHLAAIAASITTVDLDLPPDLRGKELSVPQMRENFKGLTTYVVKTAAAAAEDADYAAESAAQGYGVARTPRDLAATLA